MVVTVGATVMTAATIAVSQSAKIVRLLIGGHMAHAFAAAFSARRQACIARSRIRRRKPNRFRAVSVLVFVVSADANLVKRVFCR